VVPLAGFPTELALCKCRCDSAALPVELVHLRLSHELELGARDGGLLSWNATPEHGAADGS
jgi:hypothetical protein